jgi:hypothetical protein
MPNCKQYRLTSTADTITVSQHSDHQIQGAMVEPSTPKICAESVSDRRAEFGRRELTAIRRAVYGHAK